ncbi:MAG TPA: thioredoxin domain-containing protein [Allosphingosinicella sp.]|nr:thioredoxin domain-containing protein [Allosphingosinicella sp.]
MKSAFSRLSAGAATAALALALTACGSGGGGNNLNEAAANLNTPLPKIAAPNNGDWSQTVVETPEGGYRMGNPEAPVKLVEYASITCGACAQFSETGHQELVNDYVKSGQVSWEYRPFSLFPTDPGMFMLLRCQGPQPFFGLTEQLYSTQKEWAARAQQAPAEQIEAMPLQQRPAAWVKAIQMDQFFRQRGLPQGRIDACLADQATLQKLADISALGQREGVTGTPTFLINGEVAGVTAWSALKPRLRAAIGS